MARPEVAMVLARLAVFSTVVLTTLVAATRPAAAADDVGIVVNFSSDDYEQAAVMAAAGIRWVRTDLAWSHVERAPGEYDFTHWDRLVEAYEAHGIWTLLILGYGNALYDDGFPPQSEGARAAFAAFAGAAARHFRGKIVWEIWNEPNLPQYWAGVPDPGAYVALARSAAAAIRKEDPRARILGPSVGGGRFDSEYLEATFRLGLLDFVDGVSVHPYGAAHPEAATAFYDDLRRRIAAYAPNREIPIVVTEWGYPALDIGADAQAEYLLRAIAVNRAAGIPLTCWYNWREPLLPWNSFGLIDVRGRTKPAYQALRELRGRESSPPTGHRGP
jgi:hypothetical protein